MPPIFKLGLVDSIISVIFVVISSVVPNTSNSSVFHCWDINLPISPKAATASSPPLLSPTNFKKLSSTKLLFILSPQTFWALATISSSAAW